MDLISIVCFGASVGCLVGILNSLKKIKKSVDAYDKRISDLEYGIRGYYQNGGDSNGCK